MQILLGRGEKAKCELCDLVMRNIIQVIASLE